MGKRHNEWMWNLNGQHYTLLDCTRISQKREVVDARAAFQETNRVVPQHQQKPIALVHDSLR